MTHLAQVLHIRYGVVGNISACHADARGSIPRFGVRYGVVGNISACHADARGSIPRFGVTISFCILSLRVLPLRGGFVDAAVFLYSNNYISRHRRLRTGWKLR